MPKEQTAKVIEVIQRTNNVKSVRMDVGERLDFKAGQFLCATLKGENLCKRYLSISNSPTEKGYVEFTKRLTESDFSKLLNTLRPGYSLTIQYPMGKFTLEDNLKDMKSKIAFLSGGIGITPIRSICKYVVDTKLGTDIALLYANRTINDIAFKEDFDNMQKQYPKLKVCHALSEAAPGFKCHGGHINAQIIKDEIPDYIQRKFFLCGPPPMVEAMRKILNDQLALPNGNIIIENFVGY